MASDKTEERKAAGFEKSQEESSGKQTTEVVAETHQCLHKTPAKDEDRKEVSVRYFHDQD